MAKIVKIGAWDKKGMPTGWHLDLNDLPPCDYALYINNDGRVFVGEVEIVEWTEARKKAICEPERVK